MPKHKEVERTNNREWERTGTLCWDCKRFCCGCSWSERLQPVVGWSAIEQRRSDPGDITYFVVECPLFEED